MSKERKEQKLTLEEYQDKYNRPENVKAAKSFLFIFSSLIGVLMATALFFVVLRLFELHLYAGYVGIPAAILVFIFAYIVPIVKLKNMKSFKTRVTATNAREAKRHNKELRNDIADKMIDLTNKTDGVEWYSPAKIGKLAVARHTRNDEEVKTVLSEIYETDVREAAKKVIRKTAVRVGVITALSQSAMVDTLFMVTYELNLIKDIVYLYGYRPSEAQLARIYKNVIQNALITYGVSSATAGFGKTLSSGIATAIDKATASANFFTAALGTLASALAGTAIESGIQFAVNSMLTVIIGYQTKKYLVREYKLQEILDNVEIFAEDEEEELELIDEIKKEVRQTIAKGAKAKPAAA